MSNVSYYTAEGLQNLKDELHQMKMVERPKISQQIAEARDKGDLSENAEYDAAKEAQGMLEAKINKMENLLANARGARKRSPLVLEGGLEAKLRSQRRKPGIYGSL